MAATEHDARQSTRTQPAIGLADRTGGAIRVEHLERSSFGAEVHGVDWSDPSPGVVDTVTIALRRHLLLVLRGQPSPSEAQLDGYLRHFGRLVLDTEDGAVHYSSHLHGGGPASVMAKESATYLSRESASTGSSLYNPGAEGISELVWHNDQSHRPMRKVLSVFEALDVQDHATATQYRDLYTAYETLPPDLRQVLEHRQIIYFDPRLPPPAEMPRLADATHPIFTAHPHTGRRTIFVNDFADRIAGINRSESDEMLATLRAHMDTHAPQYHHQWRTGDLVMWDNIGLQHRRDAVPGGQRRVMRQHGGLAE